MELSDLIWTPGTYGDYKKAAREIGVNGRRDGDYHDFGVITSTIGYVTVTDLIEDFVEHDLSHSVRYFDSGIRRFDGFTIPELDGEIIYSIAKEVALNPRNVSTLSLEFDDGRDIEETPSQISFKRPRIDVVRFNGKYFLGELSVPQSFHDVFGTSERNYYTQGCWDGKKYVSGSSKTENNSNEVISRIGMNGRDLV